MGFILKWTERAKQTIRKVTQIPDRYDDAAEAYAKALAEETVKQVRERILSGSITPGLKASTLQSKRSKGQDPRVLVMTRAYVDGMEAVPASGKHSWGVRADPDKFRMLEYGTPKMPPRPHMISVAQVKRRDVRLKAKFFKDMLGFGE